MLNICCDLHNIIWNFIEEQRLLTKVMLMSSRCTSSQFKGRFRALQVKVRTKHCVVIG